MTHRITQEQIVGSMLGMAIGDALGMPFRGLSARQIAERHGRVESFQPCSFADGATLNAGEFTGVSEGVLCITESLTTNNGQIDIDNILPRFQMLARGDSRRWLDPATLVALDALAECDDQCEPPFVMATGEVAARGIPIGLVHAFSQESIETVAEDVTRVVSLTHIDPLATEAALVVAAAVQLVGLGACEQLADLPSALARQLPRSRIAQQVLEISKVADQQPDSLDLESISGSTDAAAGVVTAAVLLASRATDPIAPLIDSVNLGSATSSRSAITGAIVGTFLGASSTPQSWIDALEGRVYLLLAGPWLYRTLQFRYANLGQNRP